MSFDAKLDHKKITNNSMYRCSYCTFWWYTLKYCFVQIILKRLIFNDIQNENPLTIYSSYCIDRVVRPRCSLGIKITTGHLIGWVWNFVFLAPSFFSNTCRCYEDFPTCIELVALSTRSSGSSIGKRQNISVLKFKYSHSTKKII